MYKHWYHKDWGKTTKQRVRQIVTIGLPETILPEHVAEFGFIPFIDNPQPAHTNIEKVIDGGIVVTETEATQTWKIVDKFDTQAEVDAYLKAVADAEIQQVSDKAQAELKELDLKSIRSIREYLATKENAPKFLKDYEAEAIEKRKLVK